MLIVVQQRLRLLHRGDGRCSWTSSSFDVITPSTRGS
jgi:hypothetical protein